jgi:hypothetical protein
VPRSVPQPVSCIPHYHPGRRDLPDPVGNGDLSLASLPTARPGLSDGAHAPDPTVVCSPLRRSGAPPLVPDTAFRAVGLRPAVPTQGSFAREALPSVSATTSPCAGPPASRGHFAQCAYRRALAGCAIPGWSGGPSRFGSALLSWSAVPHTPAAGRVHMTSASPPTAAFTHLTRLG